MNEKVLVSWSDKFVLKLRLPLIFLIQQTYPRKKVFNPVKNLELKLEKCINDPCWKTS